MKKKQWIRYGTVLLGIVLVVPFFFVRSAQVPYVQIDQGASQTNTRQVTLSLLGPTTVREMRISNTDTFTDSAWEPYRSRRQWTLDYGSGTKRVYVQFRDADGVIDRVTYRDTIVLSVPQNMTVQMSIDTASRGGDSRYTTLALTYSAGVEEVRFSETQNFSGSQWYPIRSRMPYILSPGSGTKTIYAEFRDANNRTVVVSETVSYTEPPGAIKSGSVLQGQHGYLFYYGIDGKLHPFFDTIVYHSWYDTFDDVIPVSNQLLATYLIGEPVCMRAGTWLITFPNDPRIYAVELGCMLRPIYSHIEAYVLYGPEWEKRVHQLPASVQSAYRVRDPRTIYTDATIVDRDNDGVPEHVEAQYGTRDDRRDTDGDGLSDYEEIYIWFTDPKNPDTDGDGFSDGREILAGYAPLGAGVLSRIPESAYQYPQGSTVRDPNAATQQYYVGLDYTYLRVGNTRSREFTSNRLFERFIITPPYAMTLHEIDQRRLTINQEIVQYPTVSDAYFNVFPL